MALKIMVLYKEAPLVYDVTRQEDDIYQLRLFGQKENSGDDYVPEKVIIRKKGKIWVSDLENYPELVNSLTAEILQFKPEQL
ncbi:MAG: hypothetical protein EOO14_10875 [Chitinophagaceae bacterium]|nr:MAG: hypothetical protein EOO14_10875 [Chitinophagaceae bacterium]